ncbi:MAG: YczE/YyaS/YitT family protein, partial [Candidatus Izemoplasmataceae bacterium]
MNLSYPTKPRGDKGNRKYLNRVNKNDCLHMTIYVMGAMIIAFSVVMLIRSDLGTTPWDVLHVAIATVTPMTVGMATIFVAASITAFIIWVRKSWRYLLMAVPIVLVGIFIDFFNLVLLDEFTPEGMTQMAAFLAGAALMPLGGVLLVISKYPAGVFEELMLVIMKMLKTRKLIRVRILLELSPVVIGVLLTGFFKGTIGSLYLGTA